MNKTTLNASVETLGQHFTRTYEEIRDTMAHHNNCAADSLRRQIDLRNDEFMRIVVFSETVLKELDDFMGHQRRSIADMFGTLLTERRTVIDALRRELEQTITDEPATEPTVEITDGKDPHVPARNEGRRK